MINFNLYGCSFTQNIDVIKNSDEFIKEFSNEFNIENYAKVSNSNLKILNSFKENLIPNSTSVIQWSSLTRPNDQNFSLLEKSDNPLWDLLEEWYELLDEARILSSEYNIKLIQYIGWAIWKDDELNEYHRDKLNSFNIDWFYSKPQYDMISSNCFQFQKPPEWSSATQENNLFLWPELKWGGMAEWIRENIDIQNRYMGRNHNHPSQHFDPHPSEYATFEFLRKFLIPKVKIINNIK